jgi:hypothetical protein
VFTARSELNLIYNSGQSASFKGLKAYDRAVFTNKLGSPSMRGARGGIVVEALRYKP